MFTAKVIGIFREDLQSKKNDMIKISINIKLENVFIFNLVEIKKYFLAKTIENYPKI